MESPSNSRDGRPETRWPHHQEAGLLVITLSLFRVCNLLQVLAAGRAKMASMPAGGAAIASGGASPAAAGDVATPIDEPKAKEPEPEEEEEEMGFDLFD